MNGCDTYHKNCDDNPIYKSVPPANYDYRTQATFTTVDNGVTLTARCWARGGVTYNWSAQTDPPEHGPDDYDSDIYFNVRTPDGSHWGFIPDTYFVRDKVNKMGLPSC